MTTHPYVIEDREFGMGPKLWDASPEVCCAAFQLGACPHTEDVGEDGYDPTPAERDAAARYRVFETFERFALRVADRLNPPPF